MLTCSVQALPANRIKDPAKPCLRRTSASEVPKRRPLLNRCLDRPAYEPKNDRTKSTGESNRSKRNRDNSTTNSATSSRVNNVPNFALFPARPESSQSRAPPAPKNRLSAQNQLIFGPLIEALREQLAKGIEKTDWNQVRALLGRRDKDYLGKNGVPDSFPVYMGLAQKQNIIIIHRLPNDKKADTISLTPSMRN